MPSTQVLSANGLYLLTVAWLVLAARARHMPKFTTNQLRLLAYASCFAGFFLAVGGAYDVLTQGNGMWHVMKIVSGATQFAAGIVFMLDARYRAATPAAQQSTQTSP